MGILSAFFRIWEEGNIRIILYIIITIEFILNRLFPTILLDYTFPSKIVGKEDTAKLHINFTIYRNLFPTWQLGNGYGSIWNSIYSKGNLRGNYQGSKSLINQIL